MKKLFLIAFALLALPLGGCPSAPTQECPTGDANCINNHRVITPVDLQFVTPPDATNEKAGPASELDVPSSGTTDDGLNDVLLRHETHTAR